MFIIVSCNLNNLLLFYLFLLHHSPSATNVFCFSCREATAGGRVTTEKIVQQPSRSSARACKAHTATRSSPRFASSNTGDPVVLEDMRDAGKRLALGHTYIKCYVSVWLILQTLHGLF